MSRGRALPEQEVAPEDEPPYLGAGKCRGRMLADLAGRQRRIKNLGHRRVTGASRYQSSRPDALRTAKAAPNTR